MIGILSEKLIDKSILQRKLAELYDMAEEEMKIESTKTNAGTRNLPMTEDVFRCFQTVVEDRKHQVF